MSVILKGVNLPQTSYTDIRLYWDGRIKMIIDKQIVSFNKNVHAIQIPKGHGRLIEEHYRGELQARKPTEGVFVFYYSVDNDSDRFILEAEAKS